MLVFTQCRDLNHMTNYWKLLFGLAAAAFVNTSFAVNISMTTADSSEQLSSLLATGADESSTVAYWSCDVEAGNTLASDLPIRFWQDGTGFSGSQATEWAAKSGTSVAISYERGTFTLSEIEFTNLRYEADGFVARDEHDEDVVCERVGPLRGTLENGGGLLEDLSHSLLEQQLVNSDQTTWQCDLTSAKGTPESTRLQLKENSIAFRDGIESRWFVDDQFNVMISDLESTQVIREITVYKSYPGSGLSTSEIYTGTSPKYFIGKILHKTLSCTRV